MSLLERLGFTSSPAPAPAANIPAPAAPGVLETQQGQQGQQQPQQQAPAGSPPADPFATLWDNTPANQNSPTQQMNFNLPTDKLNEIAGKLDFSSAIPPEIRQRIEAGGADAVAAMMEANNIVARTAWQHSTVSSAKLTEAAIKNVEDRLNAQLETKLKGFQLNEHLATSNPGLQDPSVKPLVDYIQAQIVAKFPQASSRDIQEKTDAYFNQVASKLAPGMASKANAAINPLTGQAQQLQPETDWAKELGITFV